jgi:hypothetical protein
MAVGVLLAVWFLTTAHEAAFHNEHALCGHSEDGGAHAECVCLCACHAAVEPVFTQELYLPEPILYVAFEYISLAGTYVPAEIFRPPLANS